MLTERDIKNIFILKKKGSTISEIARVLNLDRKTIRKYLRTENQPNAESVPPPLQRRYRSYATGGDHSNKEVTNGAVYTEVFDISQEALNRFDRGQKSVQSQRQKGIKESDQIPWIVEQSGVERHQKWIEDMQKWALSNCIPFDVDIPSSLKFQIKDEVGKVLENRHERENMWEIRRLIEESVKGLVQSYLDEQEAERKAEEADRNRIRKAQLITSALGEVDRCVFINRLESYLNENARNRMREMIYNDFVETLPDDITYIPVKEVSNIMESACKEAKERIREIEKQREETKEKQRREKEKEQKVRSLIEWGRNYLSHYLHSNQEDLGPVGAREQKEAARILEEELREEIDGSESEEEVHELAHEILDEFFFE